MTGTGIPRTAFCILIQLLSSLSLWADSSQPNPSALPIDSNPNWRIGITRLKAVNLSTQNMYLASSLVLLLKEQIVNVRTHRFSEQEIFAHQKALIGIELKRAVDNLNQLQEKRDSDLLHETREYLIRKINADFEITSRTVRDRIQFLRECEPGSIGFAAEKSIQLKDADGKLYPPPEFSALRYAAEIGCDLIIWGSVEEIQGYLYCELNFFDRVLEKNIYRIREGGTRDELYQLVTEKASGAITALLGHEWASLLVDVEPAGAYIKVKEELLGLGTIELRYQDPGEIDLEISSPGYTSVRKTVALEAGRESILEITLEKTTEDFVLIQSIPPAANLYLGSLWAGKTPVVIEKPNAPIRSTLTLDGFHDEYFRLGPTLDGALLIPLVKSVIDLDEFQDSKRSRFYSSLAAFIISLPFPIFSYSMALDYAGSNRVPEWEFFSASYFWTFFISGALLVNSIIDLIRYVGSRDKPVG